MTWHDDFLAELERDTGLSAEVVADVVCRADPSFANVIAERERQAAVERGRELLLANLNDEQRAAFRDRGRFFVLGSEGGRYCVHLDRQVHAVNEAGAGANLRSYCIHTRDRVPLEDNALAVALLLKNDETEFLRIVHGR